MGANGIVLKMRWPQSPSLSPTASPLVQLPVAPSGAVPFNFSVGVTSISWDLRVDPGAVDAFGVSYTSFMLLTTADWVQLVEAKFWDDDESNDGSLSCLRAYFDYALNSSRSFSGLDGTQAYTVVVLNDNTTATTFVTGERERQRRRGGETERCATACVDAQLPLNLTQHRRSSL